MRVVIMRGVPGSGKSTYVKANYPGAFVVSADDYFTRDGVYTFDPAKLGEAHKNCLRRFLAFLRTAPHDSTLVVDNTNTHAHEIAAYYRLAECYAESVEIVHIRPGLASWYNAAARNVHGVPVDLVARMYVEAETLPAWWKETVIPATF